eukprot:4141557-Alexandrium_andersonii.AAC.1
MPGSSSQSTSWATTAGQYSSGFSASRAATTAMSSANLCFCMFGRMTRATASAPGGAPECGWGAVGAR